MFSPHTKGILQIDKVINQVVVPKSIREKGKGTFLYSEVSSP